MKRRIAWRMFVFVLVTITVMNIDSNEYLTNQPPVQLKDKVLVFKQGETLIINLDDILDTSELAVFDKLHYDEIDTSVKGEFSVSVQVDLGEDNYIIVLPYIVEQKRTIKKAGMKLEY